jgi:hypothetical protein
VGLRPFWACRGSAEDQNFRADAKNPTGWLMGCQNNCLPLSSWVGFGEIRGIAVQFRRYRSDRPDHTLSLQIINHPLSNPPRSPRLNSNSVFQLPCFLHDQDLIPRDELPEAQSASVVNQTPHLKNIIIIEVIDNMADRLPCMINLCIPRHLKSWI